MEQIKKNFTTVALKWVSLKKREVGRDQYKCSPLVEKPGDICRGLEDFPLPGVHREVVGGGFGRSDILRDCLTQSWEFAYFPVLSEGLIQL